MEGKKPVQKRLRVIYFILFGIFAAVIVFCGIQMGSYWYETRKAAGEYEQLAAMKDRYEAESQNPSGGGSSGGGTSSGGTGGWDLSWCYDMNNDTVGWIEVPNTVIDYPVLQSPLDQADFYLTNGFYKKDSICGAIYAREQCDVNKPSDNVVLYGHHMKDGSMFTCLKDYKDEAYWQDNQIIYFHTLTEKHTYRVWGAFEISTEDAFAYHAFNDAKFQWQYDAFVDKVKEISFYDTEITPAYGDKLLTLSTCDYPRKNIRFVVCAVRVD